MVQMIPRSKYIGRFQEMYRESGSSGEWLERDGKNYWSIFSKMPAPAKAGVESGFPSENATMQKCQSGFGFQKM
jgi:hypothetical protein